MGSVAIAEVEVEGLLGPDPITAQLGSLSASFEDMQKTRITAEQRGVDWLAADFYRIERKLRRQLQKVLKQHVLWPWLETLTGLKGARTARLIALIAEPHKFPGQQCSAGHHHVPLYEVGTPCPVTRLDESCPGTMLAPRTTSGTRSLWHYLGLHVVNGRSPRMTKGQQADWHPQGRAFILGPKGIADAIVLHRTHHFRDIYDQTKERLRRERADARNETDTHPGAAPSGTKPGRERADASPVIPMATGAAEVDSGLRPFQIDAIAKKVAAKAFVGDLLQEWKRQVPLER